MDAGRLSAIAAKHGIRLLLQFGSTVRGTTHPQSDLDLAVLLEPTEPIVTAGPAFLDLLQALQALEPDREVDLVLLNRTDPLLLRRVAESCRLVYGTERDLQRFRLRAFHRYQDYRPYLAYERRYVDGALATDLAPR